MHQFLADRTAAGIEPWARLWNEGHGEAWRSDADYNDTQQDHWQAALLDGPSGTATASLSQPASSLSISSDRQDQIQ
jgi:hypothetical protein